MLCCMATTSCLVKVRDHGYTHTARVGSGKQAINASCTSSAEGAARRAGAKFLRVDEDALVATLQPQEKPAKGRLNFAPATYLVGPKPVTGGAS